MNNQLIEHIKQQNESLKKNNKLLQENIWLKSINKSLVDKINGLKYNISHNNKYHNKITLSKDELKFRNNPEELTLKYPYNRTYQRAYFYKKCLLNSRPIDNNWQKYATYNTTNSLGCKLFAPNYTSNSDFGGEKNFVINANKKLLKKLSKTYPKIKTYIIVPCYNRDGLIHDHWASNNGMYSMLASKNELFFDFPNLQKYEKLLHPFYTYDKYQVCYFVQKYKKRCTDNIKSYMQNGCVTQTHMGQYIYNIYSLMEEHLRNKYVE